jgi:hypothetical protein
VSIICDPLLEVEGFANFHGVVLGVWLDFCDRC